MGKLRGGTAPGSDIRWALVALVAASVHTPMARGEGGLAYAYDASPFDAAMDQDRIHYDEQFQLVQANSDRNRGRTTQASNRSGRASRAPYMIGDSPYEGVSSPNLTFGGIDTGMGLDHPIFDGQRFNVAEANATMPDDRVFFSYRHFQTVSSNDILGRSSSVDVERFLLGVEKSFLDGMMSVDFRVPLLRQLNSDLLLYDDGFSSNLPGTSRHGELGNLVATLKVLLTSNETCALAVGAALNLPTADDARITQDYQNLAVPIEGGLADTTGGQSDLLVQSRFNNDIVNLSPYITWHFIPQGRFFHQGFLQLDVPLNQADASVAAIGTINPSAVYGSESVNVLQNGQLDQQTLLRLNLAMGYWFCQRPRGSFVRGVAGLFEVHYTAALEDANPFVAELATLSSISGPEPDVPVTLVAGNTVNDFNQVNISTGFAVDLGGMLITNGFVIPVTDQPDRSFDFEYNLQVNKRF
jgi:hypothetical protein